MGLIARSVVDPRHKPTETSTLSPGHAPPDRNPRLSGPGSELILVWWRSPSICARIAHCGGIVSRGFSALCLGTDVACMGRQTRVSWLIVSAIFNPICHVIAGDFAQCINHPVSGHRYSCEIKDARWPRNAAPSTSQLAMRPSVALLGVRSHSRIDSSTAQADSRLDERLRQFHR